MVDAFATRADLDPIVADGQVLRANTSTARRPVWW